MKAWLEPGAMLALIAAAACLILTTWEVRFRASGVVLGLVVGLGLGIPAGRWLWHQEQQPVSFKRTRPQLLFIGVLNLVLIAFGWFHRELFDFLGAAEILTTAIGVAVFAGLAAAVVTVAVVDRRAGG